MPMYTSPPKSGSPTEEIKGLPDPFAAYARATQEMPLDGKPRDRFEAEKLAEKSHGGLNFIVGLFAAPFVLILILLVVSAIIGASAS